jgi:signal transduction histidine kinase
VQLRRIGEAAAETMGALRDIIWLVDPAHDDLAHLLRKMRTVAGDLLDGTAVSFEALPPTGARPLSMTVMRTVLLIYKEALHNVARHAQARRVAIDVRAEDGVLTLRVEDDGVGFAPDGVVAGYGLASMRRRAEQAGGRLYVASEPCRGTRITLSAPIP